MIVSVKRVNTEKEKKRKFKGHRRTRDIIYRVTVKRRREDADYGYKCITFNLKYHIKEEGKFTFNCTRYKDFYNDNDMMKVFTFPYNDFRFDNLREYFKTIERDFKDFEKEYIGFCHEIYDYIMAHLDMLIYNPYVINWGV